MTVILLSHPPLESPRSCLSEFQHDISALLFASPSHVSLCLSVSDLTQPSRSSVCVYRSIWTCAPQRNSIPPASPTLAALAPLVTTQCFPTTPYRTSPASPSTSTLMETSKHEPPPNLCPLGFTCPSLTTKTPPHSCPPITPLASSGLMDPDGTGLVAALLSHTHTAMHSPYIHYMFT